MLERKIPDLRGGENTFIDEYNDGDPYPKDNNREIAIAGIVENLILKMVPDLVKKKCTILDAGCGTGDWIFHLKQKSKNENIWDVAEFSEQALKICVERNTFIRNAYLFDANNFKLNDYKYDVIVAINIFEHIKSPVTFLESAFSALSKDGVLLFSTPSRYRFGSFIRAIIGLECSLIHKNHITEYTVGQVKEMVNFLNGEVTEIRGTTLTNKGQRYYYFSSLIAPTVQWITTNLFRSHHLFHSTIFYRVEKI